MRSFVAAVLIAFAGGCVSMSAAECRGTDWAQAGERDGLNGIPARIDQYTYQCGKQNVQVAVQQYMDAWWVGNARYRDVTAHDGGQ